MKLNQTDRQLLQNVQARSVYLLNAFKRKRKYVERKSFTEAETQKYLALVDLVQVWRK